MPKVFFSYHRSDFESVSTFYETLSPILGKDNLFIDVGSIEAGDVWLDKLNTALEQADFLLLFVSPESMASKYVKLEYRYFLTQGKVIIPILIRATELPFELRTIQFFDATNEGEFSSAVNRVLDVIERNASTRISPEEARKQKAQIDAVIERTENERIEDKTTFQGISNLLEEARKHRKNKIFAKAVEVYTKVLLDRGDPAYRIEAVNALSEMRAASTDLIQSLNNDPSPQVRKVIARGLVNFQSPIISEALQIASVSDNDLEVRVYAWLAEMYFKQPNYAVRWLNLLVSQGNPNVQTIASEALLFANELGQTAGHVFVSYSRRDAENFALQLVDTLRTEHKFRVWIDTNLIPGSASWKRAIAKAIEQCSLLLLILSPEVHNSQYIGEELSYAEELGKSRLYVKYKPTHKPFGLTEMQGLRDDLIFEDYPDEMLIALVEELERRNIPKD